MGKLAATFWRPRDGVKTLSRNDTQRPQPRTAAGATTISPRTPCDGSLPRAWLEAPDPRASADPRRAPVWLNVMSAPVDCLICQLACRPSVARASEQTFLEVQSREACRSDPGSDAVRSSGHGVSSYGSHAALLENSEVFVSSARGGTGSLAASRNAARTEATMQGNALLAVFANGRD